MKRNAALAAALLALASTASAATVSLETSKTEVITGNTFEVFVQFDRGGDEQILSGLLADFLFDEENFRFLGANFTDRDTGINQLDLPNDPNDIGGEEFDAFLEGPGRLELSVQSGNDFDFLDQNQASAFDVAQLTFEATGLGTGTLALGDFAEFFAGFDFLDPDFENTELSVEVNPIPVPAAALLFAPVLLAFRRR